MVRRAPCHCSCFQGGSISCALKTQKFTAFLNELPTLHPWTSYFSPRCRPSNHREFIKGFNTLQHKLNKMMSYNKKTGILLLPVAR